MEFALLAAAKLDFTIEEQIELPGEPALGLPGSFGHGFDPAVIGGKPGHDPTRLRELRAAKKNGRGGFQKRGLVAAAKHRQGSGIGHDADADESPDEPAVQTAPRFVRHA